MRRAIAALLALAVASCTTVAGSGAYPDTADVRQPKRFWESTAKPIPIEAAAHPFGGSIGMEVYLGEVAISVGDEALAGLGLTKDDLVGELRRLCRSALTDYDQVRRVLSPQGALPDGAYVVNITLDRVSFDGATLNDQAGTGGFLGEFGLGQGSESQASAVNVTVSVELAALVSGLSQGIAARRAVGRMLLTNGWTETTLVLPDDDASARSEVTLKPANADDVPTALAFAVRGAVVGLLPRIERELGVASPAP